MFHHLTDTARTIVVLAHDEAAQARAPALGPEHLLVALLREGQSEAAKKLTKLGAKLRWVRGEAARMAERPPAREEFPFADAMYWTGHRTTTPAVPLGERAERVLLYAARAAAAAGRFFIAPEHLLVALMADETDRPARVLEKLGIAADKVRDAAFASMGVALSAADRDKVLAYATPPGFDRPDTKAVIQVGIVGVSGYGGGEVLRLCANHPEFNVVYVAGEGSAGQALAQRFPGIGELGGLRIQKWDPNSLPDLDLLFASLPSGESKEALARVRKETRIVDIGGDHRFAEGWTYGLTDAWPELIRGASRVANPGCYPAAALAALAPLAAHKLIDPATIIIDAKSGVSGAGRGGGSTFGFAEVNEDVSAYGLLKHAHVPEMSKSLSKLAGAEAKLTFTPHLIPMTRGILATCYARGSVSTEACFEAARQFYAGRPFVRVVEKPPHSKWATGSNLVFVSYAADPDRGTVIALGAIDNLGKGAAGQAVQNANLMLGLPETAGLEGVPLWP